jgi:transposase
LNIVEDRRLNSLLSYFSYYTNEARSSVKFVVIDMYSPYITLIKKMFPNASIIIDKFHLTQLISRSLNKTRIMIMKNDKKNYNKFKRYWKLILKSRDKLDRSSWKKFTCFDHLMTEVDVVDYLVNSNEELKNTYHVYQDLLYSFKNNDFKVLEASLNNNYGNISDYMKTSIKTLNSFIPYIKNTFSNNYHNGYIEGNNNFIKVLKRIDFGFRSFRRFKARIMICKGLILPKLKEA